MGGGEEGKSGKFFLTFSREKSVFTKVVPYDARNLKNGFKIIAII